MSIEIRSPHNGELVKLMPKDVGKAVKDSDGRTFYVLPDDAGGHYASLTRTPTGSAKDRQRYERTESRMAGHQADARTRDAAARSGSRSRMKPGYLLYMLIAAAVVIAVAYLFVYGPLKGLLGAGG